ncbi:hypothetical protein [Campylobacter vulpis]|uniref:hypothetical protein n=1 Tax=Campylobacter vulpis TaxID=1655500 RepID=UPI001BCD0161|nr:hypothetical protein [Campylobacter vulpis]MBS4407595.1 hypothetical protein [Campylobacter vulpis]
MLELVFNTLRNVGLGIFVNGAFALQFSEIEQNLAILAVIEGISLMLVAGYGEIKFRKDKR